MAEFLIWGRIEQTGPAEFLVIATAIRADANADGLEVMPNMAASRKEAERVLKDVLVKLGERIRSRGHKIVDVETDDI